MSKSCLIKDTTREQRIKIVADGIALSALDSRPPTKEGMEYFQKYIDGEMELDDIINTILAPYRRSGDVCETAEEEFYKGNGYYPTVEEAVKLTDEAREEIQKE